MRGPLMNILIKPKQVSKNIKRESVHVAGL